MNIKIITLNLWFGGNLVDKAILFLLKENPDIVLLQEVYNGKNPNFTKRFRTVETLKNELKFPYDSFAPALVDSVQGVDVEWGNLILSKFPLLKQNVLFFDIPFNKYPITPKTDPTQIPRNLQHVVLQIEDIQVNIFNLHGIWGKAGHDNPRQIAMGKKIAKEVEGKKHVILGGDFNCKPETQTISFIEKHLVNVFKNELTTTFNLKYKKVEFSDTVADMMFISNDIKVTDHYCPKVDVSDHLPLVAVLKI